nr:unnamed protein product [Leishmania braziliensis]
MVADLKSELYHVTRSLVQARQLARTSDETCAELRRRCQGLEIDKQELQRALQESQERLQARQAQTEEQRRDAAKAKLALLSLTAERDELSAKVQEAWDRVAELSAALRQREDEMQRLQTDITAAQHSNELTVQQHSQVEHQLRILQEQLRMHQVDEHASTTSRQRLSAALQSALERLAGLLSNVAYDYQQSLAYESQDREEAIASGMFACITPHTKAARDKIASTEHHADSTPHVVLFPANSHSASTPTEYTLMETQPLRWDASAGESTRVRAESILHSAEAEVLGDLWRTERLSPSLSAPSQNGLNKVPANTCHDPAAITPPQRCPPSPFSPRQGLVQSHPLSTSQDAVGRTEAASQLSAIVAVADEASLRTALTPLLLALKHVAAMLSNVRHERRRWVAEATHFKQRYEEMQHQLEAAQHAFVSQENQAEVSRGCIGALQRRVEQAEAALLECRNEDMRRRERLAQTLKCAEDWALIQHSVELLQVRESELSKDLQQLQEQRQATSAVSVECVEPAACEAPAEVRYQQLNQQYRTLKEWAGTAWSAASRELPQPQSSECHARIGTPAAPSTVQSSLSLPPPLPPQPPAGHEAVSAPLGSPPTSTNAAVPVAEQSHSPLTSLYRSLIPPATVSVSHRCSEGVRDPDVSPTHTSKDVCGGDAGTALRKGASASPTVANGKRNTLVQLRAGQTSSPPPFTTSAETESHTYARAYAQAPFPYANAPAINGVSGPPRSTTPPNTVYPVPLNGLSSTTARPGKGGSACNAQSMLLASVDRDQGHSWPSVSATHVAPSPPQSSTGHYAISSAITSHDVHRPYVSEDTDLGAVDGAVDYSSMFATEVLHVIEALDRRVSGALDRTPHV